MAAARLQCCHIHTKSCQIDITATTEGHLFYDQFLKEPTVHVQSQACVFANSIHAEPKTSPPWWWSLQPLILHQIWRKEGFWNVKVRWCARQTTLQLIFIITAWVYTQEAPRIDQWKSKCEHGDYWHCLVDLRELSDTVQETSVWRACSQNWHMPAAWQCLLETSYLKNKLTYFLQNNQASTLFSILCERKTPRSLLTDLTSISRLTELLWAFWLSWARTKLQWYLILRAELQAQLLVLTALVLPSMT